MTMVYENEVVLFYIVRLIQNIKPFIRGLSTFVGTNIEIYFISIILFCVNEKLLL